MCVSSYVHHCVRHCTLMMVCGIVLGKAKTTKVGMGWYEFNIVNESINESMHYGAINEKWEMEILSQIITTAPIFLQFNYFRENIWVTIWVQFHFLNSCRTT